MQTDRIAHRGFADDYPENTPLAFRKASERADAVEMDVQRCGSSELVVFHDAYLDRLTNAFPRESQSSTRICDNPQRATCSA